MSDAAISAIAGAVIGALVGGLFTYLAARQQSRLMKEQLAAMRAQLAAMTAQVSFPLIQSALALLSQIQAEVRMRIRLPKEEQLAENEIDELEQKWYVQFRQLSMMLTGRKIAELEVLVKTYFAALRKLSKGELSPQEMRKVQNLTSQSISEVVGIRF